MQSLVGIWKAVGANAVDSAGQELPTPFGPHPMGVIIFEEERMIGVIGNGRATLQDGAASRLFVAYAGPYTFDGTKLITRPDEASRQDLLVEQVRHIRIESPTRIVMVPLSGLPGQKGGAELIWERVG